MAGEMAVIESFLLQQLENSIPETTPGSMSKCFDLQEDCSKLKELIEREMPKDGTPINPKVKENLYYLKNVIVEWRMLSEKRNHPETLHSINNLRAKLKQIREDLQAALKEKADSVQGGKQKQSDSGVYKWSSRFVDVKKIYGVEDKAMVMESLLIKEGFKAIGIAGMTGVGKTALCQKAFNNQQVKKHFLPRIWVCLSKQPPKIDDYKAELVKRILMCLGFEDEVIDKVGKFGGLSKLLFTLRQQLKHHRYLIVLDDVWNVEKDFKSFCSSLTQDKTNQEQLGNGLPRIHGGAVIVTSRAPEMVENMVGEKSLHCLLPVADKDSCWQIFSDAVEKDGIAVTEDIRKRRDEIVEKCAGLPLIAKMLGQIEHDRPKGQEKNHQETQQEIQQLEA